MKVSRDVEGKCPLSSFLKQFLNVKVKIELYAYKKELPYILNYCIVISNFRCTDYEDKVNAISQCRFFLK